MFSQPRQGAFPVLLKAESVILVASNLLIFLRINWPQCVKNTTKFRACASQPTSVEPPSAALGLQQFTYLAVGLSRKLKQLKIAYLLLDKRRVDVRSDSVHTISQSLAVSISSLTSWTFFWSLLHFLQSFEPAWFIHMEDHALLGSDITHGEIHSWVSYARCYWNR